MNKITESSKEIYDLLGSGYGFNGTEEQAIGLLNEKISAIAIHYADKAFAAGRSKTTWRVFCLNNFLTEDHNEAIINIGLLCDGKEYCQCSKEAMSRGANRDIVESYEKNCPNQPH